jgi:hypothetical protein
MIKLVTADEFDDKCGAYVGMKFGPTLYFFKVYENGYKHILRDEDTGQEIEAETEYVLVDNFAPEMLNGYEYE